jgi:hypothetical protein
VPIQLDLNPVRRRAGVEIQDVRGHAAAGLLGERANGEGERSNQPAHAGEPAGTPSEAMSSHVVLLRSRYN